jgi:hypothetical protein
MAENILIFGAVAAVISGPIVASTRGSISACAAAQAGTSALQGSLVDSHQTAIRTSRCADEAPESRTRATNRRRAVSHEAGLFSLSQLSV